MAMISLMVLEDVFMRLDNDILIFLKKQANEKKIVYQTLINNLLRQYMQKEGFST